MTPAVCERGVLKKGRALAIRYEPEEAHPFRLYEDDRLIAECVRPDTLARWAFDGGAQTVVHSYDLRFAPL